jgi:hypothetical protein
MSSVVISGDTSGSITLAAPAVAGTNTITLPAATGTVMVSGNMPAFSAYLGSTQNISSTTWTKVQLNTEQFDTANCFDSTTNYRFTPNVAGYYQVSSGISFNSSGANPTVVGIKIYKNGSNFIGDFTAGNSPSVMFTAMPCLIYFNGTTDYIELYGYATGGSGTLNFFATAGAVTSTYLQATMVRSA